MLRDKFISIVENHAEQLTDRWLEAIKYNSATPNYSKLNQEILRKRIGNIYQRLGDWLDHCDLSNKENANHFIRLGFERAAEGISIHELLYALVLSRTILWKYVIEQGLINTSLEMHQALEFYNTVTNFYDKALYFSAIGYEKYCNKEKKDEHHENLVEGAVHALTHWLIKK